MEPGKLIDLIYRLKTTCAASETDIMTEFGLSPAEYNGIDALEPGEKISGSDVSLKMNLSPSRASRVVEKMVQKGYLVRKIDPVDRRKCTISLSTGGTKIKKQINRLKDKCEKRVRQCLSEQEIQSLSGALKKIIDVI
jgi:DNA-binding MarR family transcriptional regulator